MNCLLVMKIKWSLDINTGAVERSEAARARRLAGATVVGNDVIASTGYMKKQPSLLLLLESTDCDVSTALARSCLPRFHQHSYTSATHSAVAWGIELSSATRVASTSQWRQSRAARGTFRSIRHPMQIIP